MAHVLRQKSQLLQQTGNPISHNHTPGAAATVAVLSIKIESTTARTGGAPTIDGTTATQVGTSQLSGEARHEMWYVCKAFSGAQFSVSVPNAEGLVCNLEVETADAGTGFASAYHSFDEDQGAAGTEDACVLTAAPSAVGDFMVASIMSDENVNTSVTAASGTNWDGGLTLGYTDDLGNQSGVSRYSIADSTAGTSTVTFSFSNAGYAAHMVVFKSVAGATDKSLADSGGGADAQTIAATRPLADSGSGADAIPSVQSLLDLILTDYIFRERFENPSGYDATWAQNLGGDGAVNPNYSTSEPGWGSECVRISATMEDGWPGVSGNRAAIQHHFGNNAYTLCFISFDFIVDTWPAGNTKVRLAGACQSADWSKSALQHWITRHDDGTLHWELEIFYDGSSSVVLYSPALTIGNKYHAEIYWNSTSMQYEGRIDGIPIGSGALSAGCAADIGHFDVGISQYGNNAGSGVLLIDNIDARAYPLIEVGYGIDELSVIEATGKSLADSGTGVDALTTVQTNQVALADAGAGSDALAIASALPLAETGSVIDAQTLAAVTAIVESGAGIDALTVAPTDQKALADSGSGTDALSQIQAATALLETGAGVDALSTEQTAQKPLGDTGSGADAQAIQVDVFINVVH